MFCDGAHSVSAHLYSWMYYPLFFCCLFPNQFDLKKKLGIYIPYFCCFFQEAFNSDSCMEKLREMHLFCISQLIKMLIPFKLPLIYLKYKINKSQRGCSWEAELWFLWALFGFLLFKNRQLPKCASDSASWPRWITFYWLNYMLYIFSLKSLISWVPCIAYSPLSWPQVGPWEIIFSYQYNQINLILLGMPGWLSG